MAFTQNNDINFLQSSDTAIVSAGAGNDTYVLDATVLSNGQVITVSDTQGANKIQLVGGLTITSSKIAADTLQLTLSNGAVVNVLGASTFTYVTAGAIPSGNGGVTNTYAQLAAALGVATLPTGTAVADGAANATVSTDGSISTGGGNNPDPDVVTLTNETDTLTANVFNSGLVYTPGGDDRINALQDEDVLTGTGTNPTLNATLGNSNDNGDKTITPTLTGIETLNLSFTGSGVDAVNELDLQDAEGVTNAININRISDGVGKEVTIDNISTLPLDLSVANSGQIDQTINFAFTDAALNGTDDSVNLELSNVNVAGLFVEERGTADQGIETINLLSTDQSNTTGFFQAEDLQTLNISGDQDLTIGATTTTFRAGTTIAEAKQYQAGFINVAGSLTAIDASGLEGDLTLHLGAELNAGLDGTSGLQAQVTVTGGQGNDTFVLTTGAVIGGVATNTDRIDGGEGANTVVLVGDAAINAATAPNVTNVQALEIRTGHDALLAADTVTVDADAFDALATILVRNEGQADNVSGAEGSTVHLNDLTAAQAQAITWEHGTTGNNSIDNNVLNVRSKVDTATNAVQVTLDDNTNNDPVFNIQLDAVDAELVTIADDDTESNTVHLKDAVRTQAGSTLTIDGVDGGDAGKYINFDSFGAELITATSGTQAGYGLGTDGKVSSNTSRLATASRDTAVSSVFYGTESTDTNATRHTFENINAAEYEGDLIVRLNEITRADGVSSTSINSGSGNDSFIFDAVNSRSAGFTSADSITAGSGTDTLVIDGDTTNLAGTPEVNHQASEWDNLSGVDVLRFGSNATGYYAQIDNEFISQTDAGDRLTVVNNDGDLTVNSESNLELDLRGLSQDKWVTFVGANGNGAAGISSNRLVLDNVSANQNMILNGGDTDVRVSTTVGYVAGNNNILEVRNTANVSVSDLSQISNFSTLEFTNDQAVEQKLTLTLNDTVLNALADSSHAASLQEAESFTVQAIGGITAGSALDVNARAVSGAYGLTILGDTSSFFAVDDTVTMSVNLGGAKQTIDLGEGDGDVLNLYSAQGVRVVATNTGLQFVSADGLATQNFDIDALTNVRYFDNATGESLVVSNGVLTVAGANTPPVVAADQAFDYAENAAEGTVVATVLATDNIAVTGYSIQSGNEDGFFAIDANTGEITLTAAGAAAGAASNDFETGANSFTLGVVATDEQGLSSAVTDVVLNVLDLDEEAPTVSVGQIFDYQENSAEGVVLGTVAAADNVGVNTYSVVGGNDDGFFAVDGNSGVITLTAAGAAAGAASNDFETGVNSFTLSVLVTDEAGNVSAPTDILLNVLDVAEGNSIPVAGVAAFEATAGADLFTFNAVDALADAAGNNTQVVINGFSVTQDTLVIDLPVADAGIVTLDQLNGQQGVSILSNPFTGSTVVNFGNDANGAEVVSITLAGVADFSAVNVEIV